MTAQEAAQWLRDIANPNFRLPRRWADKLLVIASAIEAGEFDKPASDPVAWRWIPSEVWGGYVVSQDAALAKQAAEHGLVVEPLYLAAQPASAAGAQPHETSYDQVAYLRERNEYWRKRLTDLATSPIEDQQMHIGSLVAVLVNRDNAIRFTEDRNAANAAAPQAAEPASAVGAQHPEEYFADAWRTALKRYCGIDDPSVMEAFRFYRTVTGPAGVPTADEITWAVKTAALAAKEPTPQPPSETA